MKWEALTRNDVGTCLKPFLFELSCFQQEALFNENFCCYNKTLKLSVFFMNGAGFLLS